MFGFHRVLTAFVGIATSVLLVAPTLADGKIIRWYKMGEEEGGTNNSAVSFTADSPVDGEDIQPLDLAAFNSPIYRTVSGRPDGGTGVGIEFNAAQQESLSGFSLNWPEQSALSDTEGGLYDLAGIDDRGFQFWVRPTSTATQSLVMDTDQHGARISDGGKFTMRFADVDYVSSLTVVPNTWYHVEVVRPNGPASRSRMYVNGVAVAVSSGADYSADTVTNLTVGSNTAGNGEFFSGVIDELTMTVYGTSSATMVNYGSYNFTSENAFADFKLTGVPGDLNHSGALTQADKDAFVAGWMNRKVINGLQIGDIQTFEAGDLNLDGITNIHDLALMQNALSGAGIGAITAAELSGVPEPHTAVLFLIATGAIMLRRKIERT